MRERQKERETDRGVHKRSLVLLGAPVCQGRKNEACFNEQKKLWGTNHKKRKRVGISRSSENVFFWEENGQDVFK